MMSRYIFHVEDNMQSIITRGISDNSFIAKWGGGIARSQNNHCEKGARISETRGRIPGVTPFLQVISISWLLQTKGPKVVAGWSGRFRKLAQVQNGIHRTSEKIYELVITNDALTTV
jgi:hypothetical protein